MKNKSIIVAAVLSFLVAGGVGLTFMLRRVVPVQNEPSSGENSFIENSEFSKENHSIEEVASRLSPSVVSIVGSGSQSSIFGYRREIQNAGTGFVVTRDGYIITNKHVVEGKNRISVIMSDGEVYENVKIAGQDPLNDIAFLKIEGVQNLTPAELGDSKTLKIGQQVLAIGNALGQYQNSITAGIISGMNRNVEASDGQGEAESLSGMIQTDAAINSGNSGGPLVNSRGQVIGINTAKAANGDGIGFAIPIGSAKGMLQSLIEIGRAERPALGLSYVALTPTLAKSRDLPVKYGAYIYREEDQGSAIVSGGSADRAGLKIGDIITEVDGYKVGETGTILNLISEYKVGDSVEISLYRGQEKLTKTVQLQAFVK